MVKRLLTLVRRRRVPTPMYIQPPEIKGANEADRPTYRVVFPEGTLLDKRCLRIIAKKLRGIDGITNIIPDARASPPSILVTFDPAKKATDRAQSALVAALHPTHKYTGNVWVQLEYVDNVPYRMAIGLLIDGTVHTEEEISELVALVQRKWKLLYLGHDYKWDTLRIFSPPTGYSELPGSEKETAEIAARSLTAAIGMHCRVVIFLTAP